MTIIERPEGIKIAAFFIGSIILTSLISRVWRSTEVRIKQVDLDATAQRLIADASRGEIRVIANQLDAGDAREYFLKEQEVREDTHLPPGEPVLFFEVTVGDASEFEDILKVRGGGGGWLPRAAGRKRSNAERHCRLSALPVRPDR